MVLNGSILYWGCLFGGDCCPFVGGIGDEEASALLKPASLFRVK